MVTSITGNMSVYLVCAIISGWTIFMDLICAVTVTCRALKIRVEMSFTFLHKGKIKFRQSQQAFIGSSLS